MIPETNVLHVMVGLPRSGKSTLARTMNVPRVELDAIRLELHGQRFVPSAERFVIATAFLMVGSLFRSGHREVLVDACNNTLRRRREWLDTRWQVVYHLMPTPFDVCLERAMRDGDDLIVPVIYRMSREWEDVTSAEGQVVSHDWQAPVS
jgi:predicted kinase